MPSIPPIVVARDTRASPAESWAAIVEPDRVALWFTTVTPAGPVGSPYRIDFGDSAVEGVVTRLVPGRVLAYTWAWEDVEPRVETRVTWEVEPLPGAGSRITLTHDGWAEAGAEPTTRDDHGGYWADYIDELADLLGDAEAVGRGDPATD
jgi:uncharacterized protein YndB with AHSA1/START domain